LLPLFFLSLPLDGKKIDGRDGLSPSLPSSFCLSFIFPQKKKALKGLKEMHLVLLSLFPHIFFPPPLEGKEKVSRSFFPLFSPSQKEKDRQAGGGRLLRPFFFSFFSSPPLLTFSQAAEDNKWTKGKTAPMLLSPPLFSPSSSLNFPLVKGEKKGCKFLNPLFFPPPPPCVRRWCFCSPVASSDPLTIPTTEKKGGNGNGLLCPSPLLRGWGPYVPPSSV